MRPCWSGAVTATLERHTVSSWHPFGSGQSLRRRPTAGRARPRPFTARTPAAPAGLIEAMENRVLLSTGDPAAGPVPPPAAPGAAGDVVALVGVAPITVDLLPESDTGLSATDNVTNPHLQQSGPALRFRVDGTIAGATVTLFADGLPIGTAAATGASVTVTADAAALADGARTITARQTEAGQPQSPDSPAVVVTIDTQAPAPLAAPVLSAASDTGASDADGVTRDTTPDVGSSVPEDGTVMLFTGTALVGRTLVAGGGQYTLTVAALADGVHDLTATLTDVAGNTGAGSAALTVTVDTAAPAAPSRPVMSPASDTGPADNDTENLTPTFTVDVADPDHADPDDVVRLLSDGAPVGSGPADAAGAGRYTVTTDELSTGGQSITADVTDLAGNTGPASAALEVVIRMPNRPPTVGSVTAGPTPAVVGERVTLTARSVDDPDDDSVVTSVAFYRESNNTPGLQTGEGGDVQVGAATAGPYTVEVATDGLSAGAYTYYARAADDEGAAGPAASVSHSMFAAAGGRVDARALGAAGNGTADDTAALQRAADAAAATGNPLYLPAGTYLVSKHIVLHSGLEIAGEGSGLTTIKLKDGTADQGLLYALGARDILIRDLALDANRTRTTSRREDVGGTAVYFSDCDNVELRGCAVRNAEWQGVWLNGTSNSRVLNNTIRDCGIRGVFVTAGGARVSHDVTVSGNTVERIDRNGTGIGSGISFIGDTADNGNRVERFTAAGNITRNNGRCGILVTGGRDFTIDGNTSHGNFTHPVLGKGILVSEASDRGTITNNTCYGNRGGIDIDTLRLDNQTGYGDFTVRGNTCTDNQVHGIHVNHTARVTVDDNVVSGSDYGILLNGYGTRGCVVTNNAVSDSGTSGISLSVEATFRDADGVLQQAWIEDTRISGNDVRDTGVGDTQYWHAGVQLVRARGVTVDGNTFANNPRGNIWTDPASRDVVIGANTSL